MNLSFCAFVIFVPLCHCKVTVSLGCHLNQSFPNLLPNMPMDFKFVNDMPLEPLLCHLNHWDANQLRFQLKAWLLGCFPLQRETTEEPTPEMNVSFHTFNLTATVPLQSQCATRLKLTVKKSFKNAPLAGFQDRKGTPFENFRRASQPIRSQDSELSTNQRPRFWLNFLRQTNLKSSNGQSICQCTATPSTLVSLLSLHCHSRRVSFLGPSPHRRASSQCHLTTGVSLGPILCQ